MDEIASFNEVVISWINSMSNLLTIKLEDLWHEEDVRIDTSSFDKQMKDICQAMVAEANKYDPTNYAIKRISSYLLGERYFAINIDNENDNSKLITEYVAFEKQKIEKKKEANSSKKDLKKLEFFVIYFDFVRYIHEDIDEPLQNYSYTFERRQKFLLFYLKFYRLINAFNSALIKYIVKQEKYKSEVPDVIYSDNGALYTFFSTNNNEENDFNTIDIYQRTDCQFKTIKLSNLVEKLRPWLGEVIKNHNNLDKVRNFGDREFIKQLTQEYDPYKQPLFFQDVFCKLFDDESYNFLNNFNKQELCKSFSKRSIIDDFYYTLIVGWLNYICEQEEPSEKYYAELVDKINQFFFYYIFIYIYEARYIEEAHKLNDTLATSDGIVLSQDMAKLSLHDLCKKFGVKFTEVVDYFISKNTIKTYSYIRFFKYKLLPVIAYAGENFTTAKEYKQYDFYVYVLTQLSDSIFQKSNKILNAKNYCNNVLYEAFLSIVPKQQAQQLDSTLLAQQCQIKRIRLYQSAYSKSLPFYLNSVDDTKQLIIECPVGTSLDNNSYCIMEYIQNQDNTQKNIRVIAYNDQKERLFNYVVNPKATEEQIARINAILSDDNHYFSLRDIEGLVTV